MRFGIVARRANAEHPAGFVQRHGQDIADRHFGQPRAGLAHLVPFAHRAEDRHLDPAAPRNLHGSGIAEEQVRQRRLLTIGERQHALFAQRIAPITGQHVHQIVRIAQATHIPIDLIVEPRIGRAVLFEFVDQPLRRQPLTLHEVAIDLPDRPRRQPAQRFMIVENRHQRRLARPDTLTALRRQERARGIGPRARAAPRRWGTLRRCSPCPSPAPGNDATPSRNRIAFSGGRAA
jgi:hypothetical protein